MRRLLLLCASACALLSGCLTSSGGGSGSAVYSGTLKGANVPSQLAQWVDTSVSELCSQAFSDSLTNGTPIPAACHNIKGLKASAIQVVYNQTPSSAILISDSGPKAPTYLRVVNPEFFSYSAVDSTVNPPQPFSECYEYYPNNMTFTFAADTSCPVYFAMYAYEEGGYYNAPLPSEPDSMLLNEYYDTSSYYDTVETTDDTCLNIFNNNNFNKSALPSQCTTTKPAASFGNYAFGGAYELYYNVQGNLPYDCQQLSSPLEYISLSSQFSCSTIYGSTLLNTYKDSVTLNAIVDSTSVPIHTGQYNSPDDTCLNSLVAGNYTTTLVPSQCLSRSLVAGTRVFGRYKFYGSQTVYYGGKDDSLKLAVIPDTLYSKTTDAPLLFDVVTPSLESTSKVDAECQDPSDSTKFLPDSLFIPYSYINPSYVLLYEYTGGCHLGDKYKITVTTP